MLLNNCHSFSSSQVTDPLTEGLQLLLLLSITVGAVGEVQRVLQTAELGVVLPAQVVALVGDVALSHPGLQVPQVQPHLEVLVRKANSEYSLLWEQEVSGSQMLFCSTSLIKQPHVQKQEVISETTMVYSVIMMGCVQIWTQV